MSHLFAEIPREGDEFHVEVEPRNCCDLLVRTGTVDYWIEGKIGAALEDHQNPEKDCFHDSPKGYGREINDSPNKSRYIVLRQAKNFTSGVSPGITSGGVSYAYLSWKNFWPEGEDFSKITSIYSDFLFSVGEIGIEEFRRKFAIMEAEKVSLTCDVAQGALAMQVLGAALDSYDQELGGTKKREITFDKWSESGKSGWSMGYALPVPKGGELLWIRANSTDGERNIVWIGHAGSFDTNSPVDREVWLYGPKNSDNVKIIENKLRERRLDAMTDDCQEDGVLMVIRSAIRTPPVEQGVDLRWFQ
ncbi:MAG TPA: hypothetical protein VMF06_18190, partial [Candidatus Limnocylindria bacterium]|nr:hypothetical protein [Candidatus Limnocylindria bacterium]